MPAILRSRISWQIKALPGTLKINEYILFQYIYIYILIVYYAPTSKNWFGPVHPSVRLCVTLALGQEPLEIGS